MSSEKRELREEMKSDVDTLKRTVSGEGDGGGEGK